MQQPSASAKPAFDHYDQAVEWITTSTPLEIRPGLKRLEALMARLGNPERKLKFIHVAGTNGKGSTCAFLSSVLRTCGYDVGTFTSPYIEKYTNRIQYNGEDISEADLLDLANALKPHSDAVAATELGTPTMFEISTALALLYYANRVYPDFVVWETGLGGRLDSTNIVHPIVSVITNIGHDHMEILGDTLAKVAAEKAGIIKSGVPVITAADQDEVVPVIREAAKAKNSSLYLINREFRIEPVVSAENKQTFHFKGPFRTLENVAITMNGIHQICNAGVALMTLEVLRQYYAVVMDEEDVRRGLHETFWKGRLELVSEEPRILLDGAHNPEGAGVLSEALKTIYTYDKLHVMIGMLSSKKHSGFLGHILPLADTLILTEPDFRKKLSAAELERIVRDLGQDMNQPLPEILFEPDWKAGLGRLKALCAPQDLAVVTGTLYLISDVRTWLLYQRKSEKGW